MGRLSGLERAAQGPLESVVDALAVCVSTAARVRLLGRRGRCPTTTVTKPPDARWTIPMLVELIIIQRCSRPQDMVGMESGW